MCYNFPKGSLVYGRRKLCYNYKKIINYIFGNQDIKDIIPYLSKNMKAMGLYTEEALTYQDMLAHIRQYKDNDFSFIIEDIQSTVVYENDIIGIVEGSFF